MLKWLPNVMPTLSSVILVVHVMSKEMRIIHRPAYFCRQLQFSPILLYANIVSSTHRNNMITGPYPGDPLGFSRSNMHIHRSVPIRINPVYHLLNIKTVSNENRVMSIRKIFEHEANRPHCSSRKQFLAINNLEQS